MSIVKSFSFPIGDIRGDMFYIEHNSDNFTIIDCYLKDGDDASCRKDEILKEIKRKRDIKTITRFISTHPHNDHFLGIEELDKQAKITNFYAVANELPKNLEDVSLTKYIELRDQKNFPIMKGISRKWLNESDAVRRGSGINFLWPDIKNEEYNKALEAIKDGGNPNAISCVFTYRTENATYMWMGDMESAMQDVFLKSEEVYVPSVDVLFHPHHGRKSSAPSKKLLEKLNPKIIVIGNAPADDLNYDDPDKTITQNKAGDIVFLNEQNTIHIYTKNEYTEVPKCLEKLLSKTNDAEYGYYIGSLILS